MRPFFYAVFAVALSTAVTLIMVEFFIRGVIYKRINVLESVLRRPELYADWYDEDYWKLQVIMDGKYRPPKKPHPLLGWTRSFDPTTLMHNHSSEVGVRTPVLLYGDSFAACATELKFQDLLNNDPEFSRDHYLLNYGVEGYGVGQICLLLRHTVPLYENPIVIFSFMTTNIDRSVMSFRTGQKPYFRFKDGKVRQVETPIDPDPYRFLRMNPPKIRSYVLAILANNKNTPDFLRYFLNWRNRGFRREKELVNSYLIREAISFLKERDIDFLVVVFHPFGEGDGGPSIFAPYDSWRGRFIRVVLSRSDVPYVFCRDLLRQEAVRTGDRHRSDYFLKKDGHPNMRYNRLVADEIKRFVLNHGPGQNAVIHALTEPEMRTGFYSGG